ncbi:MAG: ATP-binding protein [Paludibacteraceae bacterium]|nr:ATP-binding protein [Paludibacteraceae bacterium]
MALFINELRIQNFGAIGDGFELNNGYIKFNQNTLLCGTQGTGKSTVAKLYSTFVWLEKALLRGDFKVKDLERGKIFVNKYLKFQNIDSYVKVDSYLHYKGECYDFKFENEKLCAFEHSVSEYVRPQISYIAAERNLLSLLGKDAKQSKILPPSLLFMLGDYIDACENLKGDVELPVNNVKFKFDRLNKISKIFSDSFNIKVSEASSGLQSSIPLFVTLRYLYDKIINGIYEEKKSQDEIEKNEKRIKEVLEDNTLTAETRTMLIKMLSNNTSKRLVSIVEEPEQNLFPDSQEKLVYELLHLSGLGNNQLVMTSHSPYIINYLTLAIKAKQVYDVLKNEKNKQKLSAIVPTQSMIDGNSLTIYELTLDGKIKLLEPYNNMPSDENMLNSILEDTNRRYSEILDIRDDEEEE